MDDIAIDELDERLRSRVLAATGHATTRTIRRTGDTYEVDARTGDRTVHMSLALRPDGSVAEVTESSVAVALPEAPGELAEPDEDSFHRIVSALDYPMFLVTTATAGERAGCLVGFVTQASMDPPRLLVCLSDANHTYATASRADHLIVHVLGEHNDDLARLFGERTGDEVDKFDRCVWRDGPGGAPVVAGTNGWIALRIVNRQVTGDHVAMLGDVVDAGHEAERPALGFQRVRRLEAGHGS